MPAIKLGAMSSMDYIPYVVAMKHGIYDSLGVQVELVKFFSANDRDAAFQAGMIDGTIIDYTGAILQQANGIPLRLIMKNDGFFYLIANKDKHIRRPDDLRGKSLSVSRNTVIEYTTDFLLQTAGLTEDEVEKPEINKIPLRLEMLQNGQIDACVLPDPFATIARANGHPALTTTREAGISVTGTMFTEQALRNKRKAVEKIVQGYNLGVSYIRTHPLSDWSDILVQDAGVPAALVEQLTLPDYEAATFPSEKDLQETVTWLRRKGLIPANYDTRHLLDTIHGVRFSQ
jgi:NitT/TauT family transport system substrate-binding protein